jgi:hypothetical protein
MISPKHENQSGCQRQPIWATVRVHVGQGATQVGDLIVRAGGRIEPPEFSTDNRERAYVDAFEMPQTVSDGPARGQVA